MRQIPEEEQLYRGVSAPQRKAVSEQAEVTEMPKVRIEKAPRIVLAGCAAPLLRSRSTVQQCSRPQRCHKGARYALPAEDCLWQHDLLSGDATASEKTASPCSW